jgi:hypothetical protein
MSERWRRKVRFPPLADPGRRFSRRCGGEEGNQHTRLSRVGVVLGLSEFLAQEGLLAFRVPRHIPRFSRTWFADLLRFATAGGSSP